MFYTVRYIAKYEMRTLLRSWFFRIFAGLFVIGLGIFNIALNLESNGSPWIYRAIDASIPYANLIILNLGQAIVAVFLASEFMKNDRKNDTVEVIYARSMSNSDYVMGKTLGILLVFFVLNLMILALGIGFSFISTSTSRSIMPLLVYPLFISLPTLIYILGLSFFVMLLLKNQAITFIVMLGYIAVSVFYLNQKAYHIFDFIAYYVPMMHSSFGGFGNLKEILVHRGIYLFMGMSFIFFTVYRLNRLPQSKLFVSLPLVFAVVFMILAGLFSWSYIYDIQSTQLFKQQIVALNNRYCNYPKATVSRYHIDVKHQDDKITAKTKIILFNRNSVTIDTLLFSLNPNLIISKLLVNGTKVDFTRQLQIVKLKDKFSLKPGDSLIMDMSYSGSIDERVCFVDLNNHEAKDNFYIDIFNVRKRNARITRDFVCLTPLSLWYPVSGVGYATKRPLYYSSGLAQYFLKVATNPRLTVISQGNCKSFKSGTFEYKSDCPLPSISLLIGDYKKYSVTTDSVTFNLFTRQGNQYFEAYFKDIKDTIPSILRDLKQEYEKSSGLTYPFSCFSLVEVPVQFALDNHVWAFASDAVQPEMILYPEKGVTMWETDFRYRHYREERNAKKNNEEISPKELQTRMFKQFVRRNFLRKPDGQTNYNGLVSNTTYSIFPCYFSFSTLLQSEKWPELTIGFESYLNDRISGNTNVKRNFWEDLSSEEWIILKLKESSLEQLVNATVCDDVNAVKTEELRNIVLAKGRQFFDIIESKYGKAVFDTTINQLIAAKRHKAVSFTEIEEVFRRNFGLNLQQEVANWYSGKNLPGFMVSDINTYKVIRDEKTLYQVKFVVSNSEKADGCFVVNIELKDARKTQNKNYGDQFEWGVNDVKADFSRKYFIPANSARELGFVFNTEPARMEIYTFISQNLPNSLIFDYPGFDELRKVPVVDTISVYNGVTKNRDITEIIVDNEDPGFSIVQSDDQPYLKRLVHRKDKKENHYSAIYFWNPPSRWESTLRSDFYGKYIHSGVYTRGGTGNNKVVWQTRLPSKAKYDVYCYIAKISLFNRRRPRKTDYNYRIWHDDGVQKVTLNYDESDKGWNLLGTYYISGDTGRVEMNNKSAGQMIYADAVKWVRSK
jgi:ABC-type transport system involved in multi-copper enzyme maturation permease subunit